jgi:hypothetical protein
MLLDARHGARQTAERGASSSTCWNVARRIGFEAHGRAEPTRSAAVITEPRPSQTPDQSHHENI